jgi:hypothetical protein
MDPVIHCRNMCKCWTIECSAKSETFMAVKMEDKLLLECDVVLAGKYASYLLRRDLSTQ